MQTMHLFAGAGGGLLADLILGHRPIVAVEWDAHCCAVLRERAAEGWFPGLHVHEGDVRLFDPSEYAGRVDCIHAGFPCQDISAAGKGEGITGSRSGLVSEVFRAIDAVRPAFVFLENSPRIRTRGRHVVIAELVARGYAWRDGKLAAADVGAGHVRDRWWLLAANADGLRRIGRESGPAWNLAWREDSGREKSADGTEASVEDAADLMREGRAHGCRRTAPQASGNVGRPSGVASRQAPEAREPAWFEVEPDVGRLVYGVADDVVPGAVKALGNGQVPIQAATAFMILSTMEEECPIEEMPQEYRDAVANEAACLAQKIDSDILAEIQEDPPA